MVDACGSLCPPGWWVRPFPCLRDMNPQSQSEGINQSTNEEAVNSQFTCPFMRFATVTCRGLVCRKLGFESAA